VAGSVRSDERRALTGSSPLLSVVIPVWNSPDLLGKCLRAIANQSYPRERFEVLVVDNGSTDTTAEVASSFPFVRLLFEPSPGSYCARNRGLLEAKGEYVVFTDADCVPDVGWLAAAARATSELRPFGIIGGQINLFRVGTSRSRACEAYEHLVAFDQQRKIANGQCATANWLSPTTLLLAIGGFDAKLKSGGDTDLARRIVDDGHVIRYCHDMIVGHPVRGDFSALAAKRRRVTGGKWTGRSRNRAVGTIGGIVNGSLKHSGMVVSSSQMDIKVKVSVLCVVAVLAILSIGEVVRLSVGGAPRRA